MKHIKYLNIYYDWMKNDETMSTFDGVSYGRQRISALCDAFKQYDLFSLFVPISSGDYDLIIKEELNQFTWASGDKLHHFYEFTPLRQTIVLFMAAMNNEL